MTNQNRVREIKSPQKKSQPAGPLPAEKGPANQAAESPHLLDRSMEAAGGHSPRASTAYLLKKAPLQTAQRQALALQLGRVQGNRALQRMLTNASPHKAGPNYPKINRFPAHQSNISRKAGDSATTETQATRLTADNMRLQCGMGRDLSAESLQSLTIDSPLPIRIERYQINDFLLDQQHGFSIITLPDGGQ